jgi:peptidoglycan/LPS O-acetylase OafA/YrhL
VAVSLILAFWIKPELIANIGANTAAALTFSTNLVEIFSGGSYENTFMPNLFEHTWFLGLEMQLYLITPLIVMLVLRIFGTRRRGILALMNTFLIIGGISMMLMMIYGGALGYVDRAYFAPDTHIFPFCIGAAMACYLQLSYIPRRVSRTRSIIAIVISAFLIVWFARHTEFSSSSTFFFVLPLVAALSAIICLLLIELQGNSYNKKFMNRFFALTDKIGSYSFGLYLFHWPLIVAFSSIFTISKALLATICVSASILLAYFIPMLLKRLVLRPRLAFAIVAILIVPCGILIARTPRQSAIAESFESTDAESSYAPSSTKPDYVGYRKFVRETERTIVREYELSSSIMSVPNRSYTAAESPSSAQVLVIGDSVTLGAKEAIESTIPHSFVDAKESRGIESATRILAEYAMQGDLPGVIVISLATNERTFTDSLMQGIIDVAGEGKNYIFVTGYAGPQQPREAQNEAIKNYAEKHANVFVVDWWAVAHSNWSLMYADHIHLNPEGRLAYADLLYSVTRRMTK